MDLWIFDKVWRLCLPKFVLSRNTSSIRFRSPRPATLILQSTATTKLCDAKLEPGFSETLDRSFAPQMLHHGIFQLEVTSSKALYIARLPSIPGSVDGVPNVTHGAWFFLGLMRGSFPGAVRVTNPGGSLGLPVFILIGDVTDVSCGALLNDLFLVRPHGFQVNCISDGIKPGPSVSPLNLISDGRIFFSCAIEVKSKFRYFRHHASPDPSWQTSKARINFARVDFMWTSSIWAKPPYTRSKKPVKVWKLSKVGGVRHYFLGISRVLFGAASRPFFEVLLITSSMCSQPAKGRFASVPQERKLPHC